MCGQVRHDRRVCEEAPQGQRVFDGHALNRVELRGLPLSGACGYGLALGEERDLLGSPLAGHLRAEYVSFYRDFGVTGQRVDLYPALSLPLSRSWGYLTPKVGARYTTYALADQAAGAPKARREDELMTFRNTYAPSTGLLILYPLNKDAQGNKQDRKDMKSAENILGCAIYFAQGEGSPHSYLKVQQQCDIPPEEPSDEDETNAATPQA